MTVGLKAMVGVMVLLLATCATSRAREIRFSGLDWEVRSGVGGPGPNHWDDRNAWVDASGRLHLKLAPRDGQWYCAELSTTRRLGFGRYQFWLTGRIDTLDPQVVLGLFNYPTADVGRDGTNEIDIEYSRWGHPLAPIGNYTVWPVLPGLHQTSLSFPVSLSDGDTTQRFTWSATGIEFQSLRGHQKSNVNEYAHWNYPPDDPNSHISQHPMPLHLNLWLFKGKPPRDGKPVEIIIRSFQYTPG